MSQYKFPVFCFRKATREIFSKLDETKAEVPIFPDARQSPKESPRRTRGGHTMGWRGLALAHATRWWGHLAHLLTPNLRLYILLDEKNPRGRSLFPKTYREPPPSSTRDREGPEALPDTLPERGITTGSLLHYHACLQSDA
jgi:hypothetical protein